MTEAQFNQTLDAAIEKAGSLRAFARKHKLSAAYISDVKRGNRHAGPRIAKALGYRVITTRITLRKFRLIGAKNV